MSPSYQNYRIIERIGGGGMGVVYKAYDEINGRFAALKLIPQHLQLDEEIKKRFIIEGKAISMLDHPNICNVFEFGETDEGELFIAMELYNGEILKNKIQTNSLNFSQSIDIIIQIINGLKYAHEKGIIHRDITPSNIMITTENSVKILDFGLAKLINDSKFTQITQSYNLRGTVSYMSPEQATSQTVDYRSDIWAIGILLYEMISGSKPFESEYDQAVVYLIVNDEYPALRKNCNYNSTFVNYIIDKCLRKNPDDRYQNLEELISDLVKCKSLEKFPLNKQIKAVKNRHINEIKKYGKILLTALIVSVTIIILVYEKSIVISHPLTIAIASANNKSENDSLDYLSAIISELLIAHLEQSNKLQVIAIERMKDLSVQYGLGNKTEIDSSTAVSICRKAKISAVIIPYYKDEENKFITGLNVINLYDTLKILNADAEGRGIESIFRQVGEICNQLGANLYKYFENSNIGGIDISKVTTRSIEAYSYYLRGMEYRRTIDWQRAKEMFNKAVEIDTTFAMAYSWLAVCYDYLEQIELSGLAHKNALKYSNFSTRKEKLMIEAFYASSYENNLLKAVPITEQLVKEYPLDKEYHTLLGYYYLKIGKRKEAIQQYRIALELDPTQINLLNSISYILIEDKEYNEAKRYLNRYKELLPGSPGAYDSLGDLFFHSGKLDSAEIYYMQAFNLDKLYGTQLKLAYVSAKKNDYNNAFFWIDNIVHYKNSNISMGLKLNWRSFYNYLTMQKANGMRDILKAVNFYSEKKSFIKLAQTYNILAWRLIDDNCYREGRKYMRKYFEIYSKINSRAEIIASQDTLLYQGWIYSLNDQPDSVALILNQIENSISSVPVTNSFHKERIILMHQILKGKYFAMKGMYNKILSINLIEYKQETDFHEILIQHNLPLEIDIKAQALAALNRKKEAIEEYQNLCYPKSAKFNFRLTNPIYHFRLAELLEYEKMFNEAYHEYNNYISICKYNKNNEYFIKCERKISDLIKKISEGHYE